jgi:hypothetical protein
VGVYDESPSFIIEDIEKTEHRDLDGKLIRDEEPANRRRARVEAFRGGHQIIRECEERPELSHAKKKPAKLTGADQVLNIINRSKEGVAAAQLV